MGAPGYSIPELIRTLQGCKDIYDKFFHKYKNVPRQLTLFKEELERVYETLKDQTEISRFTGERYSGSASLQRTLQECHEFLKSNRSVLERHAGSDRHESLEGAYKTATLEIKKLDRFRDDISKQRTELSIFYLRLLVRKVIIEPEQVPAAKRPPSQDGDPESPSAEEEVIKRDALRKAITDLISVGWRSKRTSVERHQHRDTDVSTSQALSEELLDTELHNAISSICSLTGVPQSHFRQVNFSDLTRELAKDGRKSVVSNTPIDQAFHVAVRYPSQASAEPHVSRKCHVDIAFEHDSEKYCLEASGYTVFNRRCYWFNGSEGKHFLEQKLATSPRDCYPFTSDRAPQGSHTVTFTTPQRLVFRLPVAEPMLTFPYYQFTDYNEYKVFQSDLRDRDLQREFRFETIASKNSTAGHSHNKWVKIWQSRGDSRLPSVSFPFMRKGSLQEMECSLHWFCSPDLKSTGRAVRLAFRTSKPKSRKGSSASQSALSDAPRTANESSVPVQTHLSGPLNSESQVSIGSTTLTPDADLEAEYPPEQWIKRLVYLDFKFNKDSDANDFSQALEYLASNFPRAASILGHNSSSIQTAHGSPSEASILSASPTAVQPSSGDLPPNSGSTAITSPSSVESTANSPRLIRPKPSPMPDLDLGAASRGTTATGLTSPENVIFETDEEQSQEGACRPADLRGVEAGKLWSRRASSSGMKSLFGKKKDS